MQSHHTREDAARIWLESHTDEDGGLILPPGPPRLLLPKEVAAIMRVESQTVTRWARAGKLTAIRVGPRGHRRYLESEVMALLDRSQP